MSEIADMLRRELPGLEEAVPLAPLCAYRVGGPAEYLYRASTTSHLVHAVRTAREHGVPLTVLGQATNVLVGETGLRGLTILVRTTSHTLNGVLVQAEAGVQLPELVAELAEQGLGGLEFAGNIPGSIGGAVVGNAGAYGRAIGDALVGVHFLDGLTEHVKEPAELEFGYRTSLFKRLPDLIVLSATFRVHAASPADLQSELAADAALRHSKHPLEYASCGSYFQNPSRELPAARLIEAAGLKGLTVGRAQVSEKHANFLVALTGATATDILNLAAEVKRRVRQQSGYELTEEVRLLGV